MKITIDTNIFVQDYWMNSTQYAVFFSNINIIPANIHIPEIVIDEIINKYRESLIEKVKEQEKIFNEVKRLSKKEINYINININEQVDEYKKFFDSKLKSISANIISYPEISHKEIVKNILERKKPFKKGDSGYRDFLIWQSIKNLEFYGTEEVVFITNNTKDFGDNGYLSEDFTDKKTSYKNYSIETSLTNFNEKYILPKLKLLDELKIKLNENKITEFNFENWLTYNFSGLLNSINITKVITGFPVGVGYSHIDEIINYQDFLFDEVRELDNKEKLISFTIKCKVNASIKVGWDDYINHQEVKDLFNVTNKPFDFAYSMTAENLEVKGYFLLSNDNKTINSLQIRLITSKYGSIAFDK